MFLAAWAFIESFPNISSALHLLQAWTWDHVCAEANLTFVWHRKIKQNTNAFEL
jgi:hypothetical protein